MIRTRFCIVLLLTNLLFPMVTVADDVRSVATQPKAATKVLFETSAGNFVVEMYADKAPVTVANFLKYVDEGFYNGTLFHRVIKDFMIQGGGFTADFEQKMTGNPIRNESDNLLRNLKGTIAMARMMMVDSATVQFFINTRDNPSLDYQNGRHGYAVFGKVVSGYDVVAGIEGVPTGSHGMHRDVPLKPVVIRKASRLK